MKKFLRVIGIVVLILVVLAGALLFIVTRDYSGAEPVSVADCTNPHISQTGHPMISAHRSGAGIAPENTMMAFKNIIQTDGFAIDIFEFDLHLTKDGVLVLLHDDTLDRTSDAVELFGRKNILASELTYEELSRLNMGEHFVTDSGETPYRGLRGEEVPEDLRIVRLEDVLDYLENYGQFNFVIEIKNAEDAGRQATDKLYAVLAQRGMLDRVIVGTFHGEISKYMEQTYPDLLRSASMKEVVLIYIESLLNLSRSNDHYKYVALQIPDDDYVVKLGTTRLINYAHRHNIAVQFWTINDADTVADLAAKGADAIMSDYPDMVYRVVQEMK